MINLLERVGTEKINRKASLIRESRKRRLQMLLSIFEKAKESVSEG
jgi:hypothetical protein